MRDAEIKALIDTAEDQVIIDGVIDVLELSQKLLNPNQVTTNIEFAAGCAVQEVAHATKVLRAWRDKKFDKTVHIL